METEKCELCHYYKNNIMDIYVCKRYPTNQQKRYDDWCGEFKSKNIVDIIIPTYVPVDPPTAKRGRPKSTTANN